MPVQSQEVQNISHQASGLRVTFKYTLIDGREHFIGPVTYPDGTDINQKMLDKIDFVNSQFKENDANEAYSLGVKDAHKDATKTEVWFKYLHEGYNEPDTLKSYLAMSQVADDILSLGLTVEQMAGMFNYPVENAQEVFD